jgi:coenzyme PQQ synthesis protein D (PqqD)
MNQHKKESDRQAMTKQRALTSVPVKNAEITAETTSSGDILIRYPVTMRPWLAKWVRLFKDTSPHNGFKKLQLDSLGSEVWNMIDGKRSVQNMIEAFAQIHQLNTRESESAITQFLRDLGKRGLIGMRE